MRWVFFIHNKINYSLGKQDISYLDSLDLYLKEYEPKEINLHKKFRVKRKYIIIGIIFLCIAYTLITLYSK
jgi:hypothetical protein